MQSSDVLLALGTFLGGAAPWLEAVVVVPAGILGGLHPVVSVVAGVTGNLITVAIAAWFGERIRTWWIARRRARRADDPATDEQRSKRGGRAQRVIQRWGVPMLAVLGPLGLGTQISAVVAVGFGIRARVAFGWIAVGTVVWALVAAVLAATGRSFLGVG